MIFELRRSVTERIFMRILIIEDSYILADTLISQFDKEQITADIAGDGNQGYEYLSSDIYDAAVLDLMLPGMNGFEVLQKLRGEGNTTPIIVLSAMSELDDKVTAFEYGADDYLTKPFKFKELLVRVRAIVRRQTTSNTYLLSCGDLNLDLNTCNIFNKSRNLSTNLSKKEFQLLEYLLSNQNQVVTREQIAEKMIDPHFF